MLTNMVTAAIATILVLFGTILMTVLVVASAHEEIPRKQQFFVFLAVFCLILVAFLV